MKKENKKRLIIFLVGIVIATFVSVFVTLAFFDANMFVFIRNIIITNAVFIALNMVWIRLHKRYEKMYRSSLDSEEEK